MAQAKRDENYVPSLLAVTDDSNQTVTPVLVDPITGRILVSAVVSGAGGNPGGLNTELQYNNAGAFGGISGATSNGTSVTFASGALLGTNLRASGSAGIEIQNSSGTNVIIAGAGGGTGISLLGTTNIGSGTDFLRVSGGSGFTLVAAEGSSASANLQLQAKGTTGIITFTTNSTERWRIDAAGVLQSVGAQTIRTATGNLVIGTNGGNGNVVISPNGTGVVELSGARTLRTSGGVLTLGTTGGDFNIRLTPGGLGTVQMDRIDPETPTGTFNFLMLNTSGSLVRRIDSATALSFISALPLTGGTLTGNLTVGNGTSAGEIRLLEGSGDGSNFSAIRGSARADNITYLMPTGNPTAGQAIVAGAPSGGVSQLSFATVGGGGWELLADVNLSGGAATSISSGTFSGRRNLFVVFTCAATVSNGSISVRFNNDSTAIYDHNRSSNFAIDGYSSNQTQITMQSFNQQEPAFITMNIKNDSSLQKRFYGNGLRDPEFMINFWGRYRNTSSQITRIDFLYSVGNFPTDTRLQIYGMN